MNIARINTQSQILKTTEFKNTRSSRDTVAFKGHLGTEKILKNRTNLILRHETALFRDIQTKKFVRDYILKNFACKPNIKMVIGACCTGEEAFTYSMLLNSLKSKLSILGFDLSKKSIKQANTRKIIMQKTQSAPENLLDLYSYHFKDSFLCFNSENVLTQEQIEQKLLFDKFFEVTPEVYEEKETLGYKIQRWYLAKILKIALPKYDSKVVKIKDSQLENCSFKEGDILNLTDIIGSEKADVITFSNALYHLTTDDIGGGMLRQPKENSEEIVRDIAIKIKQSLNPNGIFVLGENEYSQNMDSTIIPKVFKELDFEPLNKTEEHFENVWRLIE